MAQRESNILKKIMLRLSGVAVLFRNNRGMFLTLDGKRKVRAGLEMAGSSDLVGWTSVEIKPAMVGQTIAILTTIEVKSRRGTASDEQKRFIEAVRDAGGIAFVAKSDDEAAEFLTDQLRGLSGE